MPKPYFIGDLQTRNHRTIIQGTLVLGGPGTGKTVLVEDRIAQARQRGLFEGGVVLAEPGTIKRMFRAGIDIVSTVGAPLSAEDVRKFVCDFHSPGRSHTISGKWLFIEKTDRSVTESEYQAMLTNTAIEALMDDGARNDNDSVCHVIVDGLENVPHLKQIAPLLRRGRRYGIACLITALSTKSIENRSYDRMLLLCPQTLVYFACRFAEAAKFEGQVISEWLCLRDISHAEAMSISDKLADELQHLKPLEAIIHERPYGVEMERANFQHSLFSKLEMAARKDYMLMHCITRSATDQLDATYR